MTYTFTTLNDPKGTFTAALGINDNGDIVGVYGDSLGDYGFVDIGGKFTTLHQHFASGINDKGDIVGNYPYYPNGEVVALGFVDVGGKYTALYGPLGPNGDPLGTNGTYATGINDNGDIVGYLGYFDVGFADIGGNYTLLRGPLGAKQSFAYGINDNGEIVGTYLDTNNVYHGFVISVASFIGGGFPIYTTLNDPLGTKGTHVTGVNNNGDIVGYYLDSKHVKHGFVDIGGTFTTLDDPHAGHAKGEGTEALGINDSGEIVGIYIDSSGHHHGFYT